MCNTFVITEINIAAQHQMKKAITLIARLVTSSLFIYIFLFLATSLAQASTTSGLSYDASDSDNYNIRFNFGNPWGGTNEYALYIEDINGNGKPDLIIGDWSASFAGASSGSVYIIYDELFSEISGIGNNIDLSNSQNYNIRFDGSAAGEELSDGGVSAGDIDGDGMPDLFFTSWADRNGADSGSLYIIYNSLFSDIEGVGNVLPLSNTSNFNIRIDGAAAGHLFSFSAPPLILDLNNNGRNDLVVSQGYATSKVFIFFDDLIQSFSGVGRTFNLSSSNNYSISLDASSIPSRFSHRSLSAGDINNDGKNDLIIGATTADFNSKTNSGSVYLIDNEILSAHAGPGQNLNMSDPANFSVRYDGAVAGEALGGYGHEKVADLDNNNLNDLIIGAFAADNNLRTDSGSVYIIYDSLLLNHYNAGPGNTVDLISTSNWHARVDGAKAGDYLGWGGLATILDFNNNDQSDLLIGANGSNADVRTDTGSYYLLFDEKLPSNTQTGQTIDLLTRSNFSIEYYGATSERMGANQQSFIQDINGDDAQDLILTRRVASGLIIILNFPHTVSLDPLPAHTTQDMFTLTGSVLAPNSVTNIAGVEWSLNNNPRGTWTACSATDGSFNSTSESFSCEVTGYTEGTHQIYVRAYDTNTSYTASSQYASVGKRKDVTAPKREYILVDPVTGKGYEKTFKATALNAMDVIGDTHYPQFCFTKAYDDGAGVASYTIVVDGNDYLPNIPYNQPPIGDNGDTRQEGDSIIKENNNYYIKYHLYNDVSKQQEICAYGKTDSHYLEAGVHKWSVKATDNAGNSTSTDTLRFLVMTNQGVQSKPNQSVWFPLTLLQVGNRTNLTNYSTTTPELFTKDTKPLTFFDSTPTFYGIAPVGTTINLTLYQETTTQAGLTQRNQVVSQSTTANQSSEWGINITTPLTAGTYYATIQATDTHDNFAILKDIPLKLTPAQASTVLGATTDTNTNQGGTDTVGVLGETAVETEETITPPSPIVTTKPSPTTPPRPTPTPTTNQFCIWKWCW